ncbi:MAG: ATP-binding cassette domain-containing protein, partial [Elusimicrobiales bacterium]
MIEITNLTKSFGGFKAVDGLNLRVEPGEIFGFLGPNGAGKTTTVKVLSGIMRPTSGSVSVAGFDVAREPLAAKRVMAYIP